MKIQHLAVIFILIIMPFSLIFSEYISNQVKAGETEIKYNNKLLNATYDAMKSYQLNTINNSVGDRSNSKIDDLESAVNIFYSSLVSSFGYTGYKSSVMEEYVPVVAFTLYDGYYIYQPYVNTLTGLTSNDYEESYSKDGENRNGVKSYVYYNQRYYVDNKNDFVITYTLDNYITIEGTVDGNYVYKSGYLINGITKGSDYYEFDGIKFSEKASDLEEMKEYIDDTLCSYVKIDGTKFYLGDANNGYSGKIFYIDSAGNKQIQADTNTSKETYDLYYQAIKQNKSAYIYYKNAYEFTNWVNTEIGDLTARYAKSGDSTTTVDYQYTDVGEIFAGDIQSSDSNFYRHKSEVIRKNIETNLAIAIKNFNGGYILPKLSETDWELVENNTCMLTFLQGLPIGNKVYNGYCVVPNSLTKEYVDENDIYILRINKTYCRVNDNTLDDLNIVEKQNVDQYTSYAGRLKLDFEKKTLDAETNTKYYPIKDYLASYTSIVGSSGVVDITQYKDMYGYMKSLNAKAIETGKSYEYLKKTYYIALARERMSAYNVNNGLKEEDKEQVAVKKNNYHIPSYIDNWFYLKEYRKNDGVKVKTWYEYVNKIPI